MDANTVAVLKEEWSRVLKDPVFFVIDSDSHKRIEGTHSNFLYYLKLPNNHKLDRCALLSGAFPKSYYGVQTDENYFFLSEDGHVTTVEIPPGNYTLDSFIPVLETALHNNSYHMWTYTITWNELLNHLTFTVDNGISTVQPEFIFDDFLNHMLGFERDEIYTFENDVLESVGMLNFSRKSKIFLHTNLVSNYGSEMMRLLESINMVIPDYGYVDYICPDPESYARQLSDIQSNAYHFWVTDSNQKELPLNGQPIQFLLVVFRSK